MTPAAGDLVSLWVPALRCKDIIYRKRRGEGGREDEREKEKKRELYILIF